MWSRPVTFGGGMTMTNRGAPAGPDGWKRPSFSHREYQRSSKSAGSKVFARPRAGASAGSTVLDMKKGLSEPFHISEAEGFLFSKQGPRFVSLSKPGPRPSRP